MQTSVDINWPNSILKCVETKMLVSPVLQNQNGCWVSEERTVKGISRINIETTGGTLLLYKDVWDSLELYTGGKR